MELGYWLRTGETRQGIMTLAVKSMVVIGFDVLDMQRIQCGYNEANGASARVCAKVGFVEEARLRYYQQQPTEETREQGYRVEPYNLLCALFDEDRPRLDWYERVRSRLRVVDASGATVWTHTTAR